MVLYGLKDICRAPANGAHRYIVQHCENSKQHHVHIEGTTLTLGAVYYFRFQNSHHDGCHTVISDTQGGGLNILSAELYSDCTDCQTQNP